MYIKTDCTRNGTAVDKCLNEIQLAVFKFVQSLYCIINTQIMTQFLMLSRMLLLKSYHVIADVSVYSQKTH